ncbi:hypothetical protein [Photobacterium profundum]|uniref:hypothetical protein n=1 Tax=Photobacterium profundum TaxID=74109 RepID=UPI00030414D3
MNNSPLLDPSTDEVALIIGRTFILIASAVSKITPAGAVFAVPPVCSATVVDAVGATTDDAY